ncbi:unnamed protein product [Didymodactylos carnosus]|uniref:Uncharacterized protein n=1 Tax=Didymodactylos carnosus TaxID=1234261 RepID=A0A8S2HLU8_9BILA|nr:unnamed protein product [Didymodactylos carnosus]CAF3660567.1 unnamed protein product [Didymodactylos carnosus]
MNSALGFEQISIIDRETPLSLELFQCIQTTFPLLRSITIDYLRFDTHMRNDTALVLKTVQKLSLIETSGHDSGSHLSTIKYSNFKRLLLLTPNLRQLNLYYSILTKMYDNLKNDSELELKKNCRQIEILKIYSYSNEKISTAEYQQKLKTFLFPNVKKVEFSKNLGQYTGLDDSSRYFLN